MDPLEIAVYGAIVLLVVLLVVFEIEGRSDSKGRPGRTGYEYYTPSKERVVIRPGWFRTKVYTKGNYPVDLKSDRYGSYFTVRGSSPAKAEAQIDEIYQEKGEPFL